MARREPGEDPKAAALREARCLNPHPEQVSDAAFLAEEFFDARDVVQVKYEMVRAVTVDKVPVTAAAAAACARTPGPSSERWPGTGNATPKAADLSARAPERRSTRP